MADKNKQQPDAAEVESIEQLRMKLGVPVSEFEALKVSNDWATGLTMTEAEFKGIYDGWLKAPIGGRR